MEIQPVSKTKHATHSRTLERRDEERMQNSAAIIRSCQDTVRISRELVREARAAVAKIRKAKKS
jgi:hypothetical protein